MDYKELVTNNVSSFNHYEPAQRLRMKAGILEHIDEINKNITSLYKRADSVKFPMRYYISDTSKTLSSQKRIEAITFIGLIRDGISKGQVNAELSLLNELRENINIDNRDYVSSLFDAIDLLVINENSKIGSEISNLKNQYYSKIGIKDFTFEIKGFETRRSEFELILDAIDKGDEYLILPRQYSEYSNLIAQLPEGSDKRKEMTTILENQLDAVSRSMAFLSSRGASLKD